MLVIPYNNWQKKIDKKTHDTQEMRRTYSIPSSQRDIEGPDYPWSTEENVVTKNSEITTN